MVTCSALKQSYRDFLLTAGNMTGVNVSGGNSVDIKIVYLRGTLPLLEERLHSRHGHFAKESLLASQFATLEEPHGVITIDVDETPEQIVDEAMRQLNPN